MCWYWTGHVSDKFGLIFLWRNKNLPLLAQPLNDVHAAASVTAAAKLLQSCLTLCDLIDGSPPGFSIPGILQARTLEWVDISFSNAWKWKMKVKLLSHVRLLVTPWTAVCQASLSVTNSWSLLKLMSIKSVMPSNHLILSSPSPPAFNLSQHLLQWVFS